MMATHPKHRRRGAASLMLQWGIDKADRMDYETFVEAADSTGGHVYRKFGFVQVDRYCIRRDEPKPDDEWKKLEETHSFTAEWMWRPKQGIFTEQSV
jgi:GNAT superfamily N-acetyltransferase